MKKTLTRCGGFTLMLMLGAIYSYSSTLAKPLGILAGGNPWLSILPFVMVIASLGIGVGVGGFVVASIGARPLAIIGAVLWGLGNVVSGLALPALGIAWVTGWYGVVGGLGVGLAYIAVVSQVISWYPRARGFFSGLAVMGFGLGATCYALLLRLLPAYRELGDAMNRNLAGTPLPAAEVAGKLSVIFFASGGAFVVIGVIGATLLYRAPRSVERDDVQRHSFAAVAINPDLWVLWMMLFLNVFSGLFVITNVVALLSTTTHEDVTTIASIFSVIAVANGFGRILFGGLSDLIGRRAMLAIIFGLQFLGYTALTTSLASNLWLGTALMVLILICFGGGFGTIPAYVSDVVGIRNFAPSYGLVLTAWGLAGVIAPVFAVYARESGIPVGAMLTPLSLLMLIALILPMLVTLKVSTRGKTIRPPRPITTKLHGDDLAA